MVLYTFRCSCGRIFDEFASVGTREMPCDCGQVAGKVLTMPRVLIPEQDRAVNHAQTNEYDRWFFSDSTQAKLQSGEYRLATREERKNGFSGSFDPPPPVDTEKVLAEARDEWQAAGGRLA